MGNKSGTSRIERRHMDGVLDAPSATRGTAPTEGRPEQHQRLDALGLANESGSSPARPG